MKIKSWYTQNFPEDTLANEYLNPNATFKGLWLELELNRNVYEYLFIYNMADSIIRETIFTQLAKRKKVDYSVIYNKWLSL